MMYIIKIESDYIGPFATEDAALEWLRDHNIILQEASGFSIHSLRSPTEGKLSTQVPAQPPSGTWPDLPYPPSSIDPW
jgi:hypothetical protein